MRIVRMMMAQPQLETPWDVDELERDEEVFADDAEEAEVDERLEAGAVVGGLDGLEDADGLGPDVDAGGDGAAGVADGSAEDGDVDGVFGRGVAAEAGAVDGLGDVQLAVQRGEGGGGGRVGKEDGGEEGVADAGPLEGAVEGGAAGDLLGSDVLGLAADVGVELRRWRRSRDRSGRRSRRASSRRARTGAPLRVTSTSAWRT